MPHDAALRLALDAERVRRTADAQVARWRCAECATSDPMLRYRSGKMALCYDCQRFRNLQEKCRRATGRYEAARQPGMLVRPARLLLDKASYLTWCRTSPRVCHYCAITQEELPFAAVVGSNGRPTEAIGVDRIDNTGDYELANLAWCCSGCNGIKSNRFTDTEMRELAVAAAQVYRRRVLAAFGIC